MEGENFAKAGDLGKEGSKSDESVLNTNEIITAEDRDAKLIPVQSSPFEGQELPEELKELFKGLIEGLGPPEGPMERPERQSEGMKKFDQAMNEVDLASIKAFKDNQPQFRESIKETDEHLVAKVDTYEAEGAESGRFDRIEKGKSKLKIDVNKVSKHLKDIPFHDRQVHMIERVNGYLNPETDPDAKAALLEYIKDKGSPELAADVIALGKTQDELRPDLTVEIEKRNEIFQAYSEAHEAKQTYNAMLSATMRSPNTSMDDAKVMGEEMRGIQGQMRQQQRSFSKFSIQQPGPERFKIEFPKPKKPKTVTA